MVIWKLVHICWQKRKCWNFNFRRVALIGYSFVFQIWNLVNGDENLCAFVEEKLFEVGNLYYITLHLDLYSRLYCQGWCSSLRKSLVKGERFVRYEEKHKFTSPIFSEICPHSCKLASHVIFGSVVSQLWSETPKQTDRMLRQLLLEDN